MFSEHRRSEWYPALHLWKSTDFGLIYRGRCSCARSVKVYLDWSRKTKFKIKFKTFWKYSYKANCGNIVLHEVKTRMRTWPDLRVFQWKNYLVVCPLWRGLRKGIKIEFLPLLDDFFPQNRFVSQEKHLNPLLRL